MANTGEKKRPSKTLVFTGLLGWVVIILEWINLFTLIPIMVGAVFYVLEKILDVLLGRIFRRKPKQQFPNENSKD
ncbi:hypothetical protein GCM10007094_32860 [Pseudovibrio japonicus]|uniref:Transmembrane protein n=1 Tax=Pseudovibrio japonicus TaxID=366534 RepID=A0ABQ3EIA6_9HYPH|nr:hypothetical protein [Pseudovibrio japonicus]GHB40857.1 hypothetical protein GCM10007094_32860 [Pseudovibrio japonicus]